MRQSMEEYAIFDTVTSQFSRFGDRPTFHEHCGTEFVNDAHRTSNLGRIKASHTIQVERVGKHRFDPARKDLENYGLIIVKVMYTLGRVRIDGPKEMFVNFMPVQGIPDKRKK